MANGTGELPQSCVRDLWRDDMIFAGLVANLALLVACGTIYGLVAYRLNASSIRTQIFAGILFGGVAVTGMMLPFTYAPGIIFDGRSVLLSVAGLFGGPVVAAIAAVIASAYRLWLGGGGALTGIAVILTSAALGVGFYYKSDKQPHRVTTWQIYALGVVVHACMLLWMFSLPWPSVLGVLRNISLPVMVAFPLATLLLGTILSDMANRYELQKQLKSSSEHYSAIVRTQTVLVDRWLPDGTVTFVNEAYCSYYGHIEEELIGRNWLLLVEDEDRGRLEKYVQQLSLSLAPDQPIQTSEHRAVAAGGRVRWTSWVDRGVFDEKGILKELQSTGQDITERKQAEEALIESEEKLRHIIDNSTNLFYSHTPDHQLSFLSPQTRQLLNCTPEEAMVIWTELATDNPINAKGLEITSEAIRTGNRQPAYELELIGKRGRKIWVEVNETPVVVNEKTVSMVGSLTDITKRKHSEEDKLAMESQLRQAQKLESLGTMASGVAHEINNPLMGMINYADLINMKVEDATMKEYSQSIMEEGNRIAKIVSNLLSFSRQDKESHSPAALADIIDNSLSLVGTFVRKDQITIELDIPEDLPQVKCRSQQIQQVLINLLTNAHDALNLRYPEYDENKLIRITARRFEKDGEDWIRTTVEDHGEGIPADLTERIFDPFFSTKPKHKGTGLGLSISYGIVREHHGELTVESAPGEITQFHIDLRVNNGWSHMKNQEADA